MDSQLLPRIAPSCNKYMLLCVLCPWWYTEYVLSCVHVSLDIVFKRFLPKVNIDIIHNISVLKYLQYARDYYIHFDGKYDCWLLNQEEWTVMPSVCFVEVKKWNLWFAKITINGQLQLTFTHYANLITYYHVNIWIWFFTQL